MIKIKQAKNNEIVCFAKGTKVLLKDRSEKNIENVSVGEEVLTYNAEIGEVESDIVEKIASSTHSIINLITYSNGTTIESTTDHPFFVVGKGWASVNPTSTNDNYNLTAQELHIGDKCLQFNNNNLDEVAIINIQTRVVNQEMHVISAGKNNSFFANGIIVSDENLMLLNLVGSEAKFSEMKLM